MDDVRLLRDPANAVPASSVVTAVSETVVACLTPLFRLLGDELRLIRESLCTPQQKTPFIVGMHVDSEGASLKEVTPPGYDDDDYDGDLEAFEAQLVLLSPSRSEHAFLHLGEEESTRRAALQADCAAFFRGVAAAMVTSVPVEAHRSVVAPVVAPPAGNAMSGRHSPVVEAETVARRVIMGDASAALFTLARKFVSAQDALAVRVAVRSRAEVEFFDGEAAARRGFEIAAFAPFPHVPAPTGPATAVDSETRGTVTVTMNDRYAHPAEPLIRESLGTPPPKIPFHVGLRSDRELGGDATFRDPANTVPASDTVHGCEPPPNMRFDPRYKRTVPTCDNDGLLSAEDVKTRGRGTHAEPQSTEPQTPGPAGDPASDAAARAKPTLSGGTNAGTSGAGTN